MFHILNSCGVWSVKCGVRYVSSTGGLIMNTVSQHYSHSSLHTPHSSISFSNQKNRCKITKNPRILRILWLKIIIFAQFL